MTGPSWIDLLDPSPEQLTAALPSQVHRTALERLETGASHDDDPRPRLEVQGDYLFGVLVVPLFVVEKARVAFEEIDVVVDLDRLVTVRRASGNGVPLDIESIVAAATAAGSSPGMCLYALVDEIAERFLSLIDSFDEKIDELEDHVEDWEAIQVRERISGLRHDILHVRRVLTPTRDLTRSVLDDRVDLAGGELFPPDVEIHFADGYDKLLRATDGLDLSRDLLAGVRDYHQAQVANDQNEVMKRLTVVASVLLLPTFIVGLYGQNLKGIPELRLHYGYAWSWGLIILTTVAQLVYFRRKRWI